MQVTSFLPLLVAFAASLVLTPVVRYVAARYGMIARPKSDRWHKRPTAMMGGVAIMASVVLTWGIFYEKMPSGTHGLAIIGASVFLFVVGIVDDVLHIRPYQKLIGQVIGASVVVYAGLSLSWTSSTPVNTAITFFWLIGITNALNLLDNMDGLAAGIAAIAASFLSLNFFLNGSPAVGLMCAIFAAALVGFLIYNSNPASIFMGDCGSMFIGFFLASAALPVATGARARSFAVVVAVPLLVLLIPIFDTTLVTVMRKLVGRAASQGGRDHTSHRLVALGLSERRAVLLLYALAAVSGILAVLVNRLQDVTASIALILAFGVGLSLLGVYLGGVRVYEESEIQSSRSRPIMAFFLHLTYKRRIFEVSLDLVLILLSYYAANKLVRAVSSEPLAWEHLMQEMAVLVSVQLTALLVSGAYRGLWRYVSLDNLVVYTKAVVAGTVAGGVLMAGLLRDDVVYGRVLVVDAMVLLLLIVFSRLTFRMMRRLLPSHVSAPGRRALIYGAGDGGELMLRELLNNRELGLTPIGFVDDDPLKAGKVIHGLRVHPGSNQLLLTFAAVAPEVLIVSSSKFTPERFDEVQDACARTGISLRRMSLKLEVVYTPERDRHEPPPRQSGRHRRVSGSHLSIQ